MEERIEKINEHLVGWCGYFALADTPTPFKQLDEILRRRLRMCLWKQWKLPKTKTKRLISLGVPKEKAYEWGNTRKKYWRISKSPILHTTLNLEFWRNQKLKSLLVRYNYLRHT